MASYNLLHISLGLNASPPITVLCSWKLHVAGTWDSYEISLSDKEKLGLSSKCIYCAQELNWEGNVFTTHTSVNELEICNMANNII